MEFEPTTLLAIPANAHVALVLADRILLVPRKQDLESIGSELSLGVANHSRVAEQEVERGARHRTFAGGGLEAHRLEPTAGIANRRQGVGKVDVGKVAAEAVAADLAGKEVVDVAAHRLVLAEPRLRDDVLAVVGKRRLDRRGLGS